MKTNRSASHNFDHFSFCFGEVHVLWQMLLLFLSIRYVAHTPHTQPHYAVTIGKMVHWRVFMHFVASFQFRAWNDNVYGLISLKNKQYKRMNGKAKMEETKQMTERKAGLGRQREKDDFCFTWSCGIKTTKKTNSQHQRMSNGWL